MSWNDIWKEHKKNNIITDYHIHYHKFLYHVNKKLPDNALVLEAGCGSAESRLCFSPDKQYTGLDYSEEAVKDVDFRSLHADIMNIPIDDNYFDFVYNSGVIEHFDKPTDVRAISEMIRVTKKGGLIFVAVPNRFCPWYRFAKWFLNKIDKWPYGQEFHYSMAELKKCIVDASNNVSSDIKIIDKFSCQVLPPLSTYKSELIDLKIRKKIAVVDSLIPFKDFLGYTVGILFEKK